MAAPPAEEAQPPADAPPAAPTPTASKAPDCSKTVTAVERASEAAPPSSSAEQQPYSYGPPFPGPPFGHGPWSEHRGHWHGKHHGHHMGHHHRGRHPPPDFQYPSYPGYWDHAAPPGWHSHPMSTPHPPPPRPPPPFAAGMFHQFHHPPWVAPSAVGESTGPTEASTAGEQSSVKAPSENAAQFRLVRPKKVQTSTAATSSAGELARNPSLVAEIVSRVTQSLLASTGGKGNEAKEELAQLGKGPGNGTKSGSVSIPEELLQSIHHLQEGLRLRGPPSGPEGEAARLLAQQKRRLRKGRLGKLPTVHKRSNSQSQSGKGDNPTPSAGAENVSEAAQSSVPPSLSADTQSEAPSAPTSSIAPASSPVIVLPPYLGATAPLSSGVSSFGERRLVPIASAPGQSSAPSEATASGMFVDLRPKKKRGPPARGAKEPMDRKALGRPRKPLLAMKCSKGEGLQGRKSGAIRKKLGIFGQKLQALVAEQLYATTPDKIERAQMEEAITLMLTHKVCGVRSSAVMQLLEGSLFSKERMDIPVEEAPPTKRHKKSAKGKKATKTDGSLAIVGPGSEVAMKVGVEASEASASREEAAG